MSQQYIVQFEVPSPMDEEFTSLVPQQRLTVDDMMSNGKILTYMLSVDMSTLWVVFNVTTEKELADLIDDLPLSRFMEWNYQELFFHMNTVTLPVISPN